MLDDDGNFIYGGHASLWHAWEDKPGIRHVPSFLRNESIYSGYSRQALYAVEDMERLIYAVAHNGLFTLTGDVLSERTFSYANELIGDDHVTPYLSRTGNIAALRVSTKRKSGFLVPTRTWKWENTPGKELIRELVHLFQIFGFESSTPASLSEKVLRATLPTPLGISRPSVWLRRDILNNHTGGRIDLAEPQFYRRILEYDKVKAYPFHSRNVPSPFRSPVLCAFPDITDTMDYATGWWNCVFISHQLDSRLPSPIQVDGKSPVEGEVIDKWLWTGELLDCIEAGYTLVEIKRGYGWHEMSDFMCRWVDLLWNKHEKAEKDSWLKEIIKSMMVGLPGRFLRKPETYTLVPLAERRKGDIPLMMHWRESDDRKFSDYVVRAEYDKESTALSYIGSYIVAEMRRELYHMMKREVEHGNTVIRSYIDCFSIDGVLSSPEMLGTGMGQWKEKEYTDVYAESNRFVGVNEYTKEKEMKYPGAEPGNSGRIALWEKYHEKVSQYPV
jgi:DNA polymerase family B